MLLAVAGLISVTIVSCGEEEKKEPKGTNELTQKPKEENEPMTLIPDVNFENVLIFAKQKIDFEFIRKYIKAYI